MGNVTGWIVDVASETDAQVRACLARRGMKGNLSRFVEDAVKLRLFDLTLREACAGFDDLPEADMTLLIDEALDDARRR